MRNFLFLFILLPGVLLAQPIIPLTSDNFPDAIVGKPDTYETETLLEYNEGGDLFIEFGFRSLIVQEIAWENAKIKVEVYQMEKPEAAFGVYSLLVTKCLHRDTLTPFDCTTAYQYQTAYGNLYLSITSETGSEAARARYMPVSNTNTNDGLYREFQQLDELNIYFLQSQEPWPISAVINQQ